MVSDPPLGRFPSGGSYPCPLRTAGRVPVPTDRFPSCRSYTCPSASAGACPGVCPWVWKRWPVPTSGAQDGSCNLPLPPELLSVASCCLGTLTGKEVLMVVPPLSMCLPIMVTCLSGGPRFLPSTPSVATAQPLKAVSTPNPGPLLETDLQSLSFIPQPPHTLTEECLRLGSAGWWCRPSVQVTLSFAFHKLIAAPSS